MRKSIFILLFALLNIFSARAYDFEVDGIYYKKVNSWYNDASEVQVTSGDDEYSDAVVIPAMVEYNGTTYNVTSIGESAFKNCTGLTSVTIPESVTSIEFAAFGGCTGLTSVEIPANVTYMGFRAFEDCTGLTSITIQEGVTIIGYSAFGGCTGLTSVTIPNSVTSIGGDAFQRCTGLTSVTIPESVTSIGSGAFQKCTGLTSVTIPNSVTSIEGYTFSSCSGLTSVTIPNSVTSIGMFAFSGCSGLTSVTIPEGVTFIGWGAFSDCEDLTSVTIPDGVTYISGRAFEGCTSLTSVTIPERVDTIWYGTFKGCSSLTSVTLPNSVTVIGEEAFEGCSSLTSVTLPNSVTVIGKEAFYNCSGLTSVTFPESIDSIGIRAFRNTSISAPLYNGKVFAYMPTDYRGDYEIPSGIKTISDGAFSGCNGLTSVMIPEGVITIGSYAFSSCSGLTSVTIPESVTFIGNNAFVGTSISFPVYNSNVFVYMPTSYSGKYEIPSGIQMIAGGAFLDCRGLTSVTIPESVTSIGSSAFSGCSSLTSITIPESVTSINAYAFEGCGFKSLEWNAIECSFSADYRGYAVSAPFGVALTSVSFGNNVKYIPGYLCENCRNLTSVTIPESVTSIGDNAFVGTAISSPVYNSNVFAYMPRDYKETYVIPSGIQMISGGAFYGCKDLTSITIPEGVTFIGTYAFRDCEGLTSVTIPEGVVEIGYWGFNGCSGLKSIVLPATLDTIGYNAFGECCNCDTVICFAKNPPFCSEDDYDYGFYFCVQKNLYVPRDSKSAYRHAPIWQHFENIKSIEVVVTAQPNDTSMGCVTGGGEYKIGEQITIEAIPNPGYHFVKWDDGVTANPRTLTVTEDITLTAIFAKNGDTPTANENLEADNFRVYVQDRTIHLSEDRGLVQVYNMAGQCIYNGHATAIPVPHPGVYILRVADGRSRKVLVR